MNLAFPYAWSNPSLPRDKLLAAVLERGLFEDLCRVARDAGLPALRAARARIEPDALRDKALDRMLRNIESGFAGA